jgi:predicted nuclease of predicted toxin-antitoxin system
MRILADENFPREAVEALRQRGHDVLWARTDLPGASDTVVLKRAAAESRLVITFDKGFGALALWSGLAAPAGVLLLRISPRSPSHVAHFCVSLLDGRADWAGHFSVAEEDRLRMRPLSAAGTSTRKVD